MRQDTSGVLLRCVDVCFLSAITFSSTSTCGLCSEINVFISKFCLKQTHFHKQESLQKLVEALVSKGMLSLYRN